MAVTQTTLFADQQILDTLLRGAANKFPPIANLYVGLVRYKDGVAAGAAPTRDNVVEIAPANTATYGRVAIGKMNLTPVAGATPAFVSNDGIWQWAEAGEDWGQIVGQVLCDAAQGGNAWWYLFPPIANQRTIRKGDSMYVPAGQAQFQGGSSV